MSQNVVLTEKASSDGTRVLADLSYDKEEGAKNKNVAAWEPIYIDYSLLLIYLIELGKLTNVLTDPIAKVEDKEKKTYRKIENLFGVYNANPFRDIYFSLIIFNIIYVRYFNNYIHGLKECSQDAEESISHNLVTDNEKAFLTGLEKAFEHFTTTKKFEVQEEWGTNDSDNILNSINLSQAEYQLLKNALKFQLVQSKNLGTGDDPTKINGITAEINNSSPIERLSPESTNERVSRAIISAFNGASFAILNYQSWGQWLVYGFGKICAFSYAIGCLAIDIVALYYWLLGLGCTFWPMLLSMVILGIGVWWLNYSAVYDLVPMRILTFFTLLFRGELWRRLKNIVYECKDGKPNKLFRSVLATIFIILSVGAGIVMGIMAGWYMFDFLVVFCGFNPIFGIAIAFAIGLFTTIGATVLFIESMTFFLNSKWFKAVSDYISGLTWFKYCAVCIFLIITLGLALFGLYCLSASGQAGVQNVVSSFANESVANGLGIAALAIGLAGQVPITLGAIVEFIRVFEWKWSGWNEFFKMLGRFLGCAAEFGLAVNGETFSSNIALQMIGAFSAAGQDFFQYVLNNESVEDADPKKFATNHKNLFLQLLLKINKDKVKDNINGEKKDAGEEKSDSLLLSTSAKTIPHDAAPLRVLSNAQYNHSVNVPEKESSNAAIEAEVNKYKLLQGSLINRITFFANNPATTNGTMDNEDELSPQIVGPS